MAITLKRITLWRKEVDNKWSACRYAGSSKGGIQAGIFYDVVR